MMDVLYLGLPGGGEKRLYIRQEDKDEHLPGKLRTAAETNGVLSVHASVDEDGSDPVDVMVNPARLAYWYMAEQKPQPFPMRVY